MNHEPKTVSQKHPAVDVDQTQNMHAEPKRNRSPMDPMGSPQVPNSFCRITNVFADQYLSGTISGTELDL